jgi:hypothetical protein
MRLYRRADLEEFKRMARRRALARRETAGHRAHQPQPGGETDASTQ